MFWRIVSTSRQRGVHTDPAPPSRYGPRARHPRTRRRSDNAASRLFRGPQELGTGRGTAARRIRIAQHCARETMSTFARRRPSHDPCRSGPGRRPGPCRRRPSPQTSGVNGTTGAARWARVRAQNHDLTRPARPVAAEYWGPARRHRVRVRGVLGLLSDGTASSCAPVVDEGRGPLDEARRPAAAAVSSRQPAQRQPSVPATSWPSRTLQVSQVFDILMIQDRVVVPCNGARELGEWSW